ncbi:hypothetical protein H2200_007676 [Cladophialophora chaetospira]|uniref:Transcription factor domain-containing protein n=1 Tax=Cladophialophora chaetospira TaxID=386627 RepID=A0AA38X6P8_9EURO|nr:hypothetical protein H2200_007676 [Cladophialophora chaetospira]
MTEVESNATGPLLSAGSVNGSVTAPIEADDNPPLMSLFDNEVFGHQEQSSSADAGRESHRAQLLHGAPDLQLEKLCLVLGALLPSQEDANTIAAATNAWGIARTIYPANEGAKNPQFHVATISKASPLVIARNLMKFAIFLQQMPPEFDPRSLHFESPVQSVLQQYLHTVTDLVTSKDDYACTLEGLECLLLQSLFYINDGNLRRAWLAARRCLAVAQFLGLQKSYLAFVRKPSGDADQKARAFMWVRTVMVDRYLAPILGLPSGVTEDCFGDKSDMCQILDPLDILERRLCVIAGLIAARNQKEPPPGYNATLDIDDKMELFAKEVGDTLSRIPDLSTSACSREEDTPYKVVLNQLWFYQLTLFLHIPWMLRAFTDNKFEYSRISCLHASREALKRYLALRSTNNTQGVARVVDFATVIASTTLILNQVGSAPQSTDTKHKGNDLHLVEDVVESMRTVSRGSGELMARQGVQVVEALMKLSSSDPGNMASGSVRLTIPFFGPISIRKGNPKRNPAPGALMSTYKDQTDMLGGPHELNLASGAAGDGGAENNATFDHGNQLSFEHTDMSESGWLPPLEAWDFDNISDLGNGFGLWDVPSWDP